MFNSGFNESTFSIAARASSSHRPLPAHTIRELEDEGEPEYGVDSSAEAEDDSDLGWDEDDDSGEEEDDEPASSSEEAEGDVVDAVTGTPRMVPAPVSTTHAAPVSSAPPNAPVQRSRSLLDAPARSRTSSAALSDDERTADLPPPSTPPMQRQDSVRTERAEDASDTEGELADPGANDPGSRRSRYVDASSAPPSPVKPTLRAARQAGASSVTKRARSRPVDDRPRFEVVVTDAAWVFSSASSSVGSGSRSHLDLQLLDFPRPAPLPLHRLDPICSARVDLLRRARPRRRNGSALPVAVSARVLART